MSTLVAASPCWRPPVTITLSPALRSATSPSALLDTVVSGPRVTVVSPWGPVSVSLSPSTDLTCWPKPRPPKPPPGIPAWP